MMNACVGRHIYRVVSAKLSVCGKITKRWMIVDNKIPVYELTEWVELKSLRKASTGREYANKLSVFLNFLSERNIEYDQASRNDVLAFIDFLIYGLSQNDKVININNSSVTYNTLSLYITVITEFYEWLYQKVNGELPILDSTRRKLSGKSFLYGQIYDFSYFTVIEKRIRMLKSSREYIKWYTEEEKETLISNFLTLRDQSIFLITLEGMRIDEVLSIRLSDYDNERHILRPSRSKGRETSTVEKSELRPVVLPERTYKILDAYIFTERADAEAKSGGLSEWLFINLRSSNSLGNPLSYRSFWETMKRCAKRAGFDESKIRTHSGRSTKVMEILEHQSKHPEDGITDVIIMELMGWKSMNSINPYKQEDNMIIAMEAAKKIHNRDITEI